MRRQRARHDAQTKLNAMQERNDNNGMTKKTKEKRMNDENKKEIRVNNDGKITKNTENGEDTMQARNKYDERRK